MNTVAENIHQAVDAQAWQRKVMIGDPELTPTQAQQLLAKWQHPAWWSPLANGLARMVLNLGARWCMRQVTISGQQHLPTCPAIVTSNHFSPLENLAVRKALGMRRLFIVSQLENLAMSGMLGWLMRHADTLPVASDKHYLGRVFPKVLQARLAQASVLIYPEQELWLHYRKPRQPQRAAYYYAARFNVPIISLFVVQPAHGAYQVMILNTLWPDSKLSVRAASIALQRADFAQKIAAYEAAYHKPYTPQWEPDDLAEP